MRGREKSSPLTETDDVTEQTEWSKVEAAVLDIPSLSENKGDRNWASVTKGQEHDTDTGEGVIRGSGAEVDKTEQEFDYHAEEHRVQGDVVETGFDLLKPLGAGDGSITGEGPDASGCRSYTTYTTDDTENQQRDEQAEGSGGVAGGGFENGRNGLTGCEIRQVGDIGEHKRDGDQKGKTGQGVQDEASDDCFGNLNGWRADFFTHADFRDINVSLGFLGLFATGIK